MFFGVKIFLKYLHRFFGSPKVFNNISTLDTFLNRCKIFKGENVSKEKPFEEILKLLFSNTRMENLQNIYSQLLYYAVYWSSRAILPNFSVPSQTRGHKTINITYVPARFILYCNAFANLYNSILCIRDHPYITSAKELGGWGQKNDSFC